MTVFLCAGSEIFLNVILFAAKRSVRWRTQDRLQPARVYCRGFRPLALYIDGTAQYPLEQKDIGFLTVNDQDFGSGFRC